MNVRISFRNTKTDSVTTSATGANWVALPANRATEVDLANYTGTDLEYRVNSGAAVRIFNSTGKVFKVNNNTSTAEIRRVDQSNTPVTAYFQFVD